MRSTTSFFVVQILTGRLITIHSLGTSCPCHSLIEISNPTHPFVISKESHLSVRFSENRHTFRSCFPPSLFFPNEQMRRLRFDLSQRPTPHLQWTNPSFSLAEVSTHHPAYRNRLACSNDRIVRKSKSTHGRAGNVLLKKMPTEIVIVRIGDIQ